MKRLYLDNSYKTTTTTYLQEIKLIDDCTALLCEDLIYHPEGGGQPADYGDVTIANESFKIKQLKKQKGEVYIVLMTKLPFHDELAMGDEVTCTLDWTRRYRLMRHHTAAHALMAAARQSVLGYSPKGIQIREDGEECEIRFASSQLLEQELVDRILCVATSAISQDCTVRAETHSKIEEAQAAYPDIFRADPNLQFKGALRLLVIEGLDANPCGGTHVNSLGEIGAIHRSAFSQNAESLECRFTFYIAGSK